MDVENLVRRTGKGTCVDRPGLVVALDSVTDPHNLSAVIHSTSAFGTDGVVVPERRSASVSATVWKASVGAAARVPTARVPSLVAAPGKLKTHGYFVVGLDGHGDTAIEDISFTDVPIMLAAGSEGKGFTRLIREVYDVTAPVPIATELKSLNVVITTGIALYQINRLRARSQ